MVNKLKSSPLVSVVINCYNSEKFLKEAIDSKYTGENSLSAYDKMLWDEIGPELGISTNLQKLARSKFLLNFVINRASRNENLKDIIGGMLANEVARGDLTNPLF